MLVYWSKFYVSFRVQAYGIHFSHKETTDKTGGTQ